MLVAAVNCPKLDNFYPLKLKTYSFCWYDLLCLPFKVITCCSFKPNKKGSKKDPFCDIRF